MLYACPRCTQMLPTDAAFCRRCGAAVHFSRSDPIEKFRTNRSVLTPVLVVLLIGGIALAGFVGFSVRYQQPTVQPAVAYPQPFNRYNAAPTADSTPQEQTLPLYAPTVQVYPTQPPVHYRENQNPHRR